MLLANILKKEIFDKLHALGMLIAKCNSAMLVISSRSGKCSCELLKKIDMVCPPNLKTGILTAEAVHKIDHRTSLTMAISFHGTCGIALTFLLFSANWDFNGDT